MMHRRSTSGAGRRKGDGTQDPITWLEEFDRAAKANHWTEAHQLELASAYMKDNAQEWLTSLPANLAHYNSNANQNTSFTHQFKIRFNMAQQKAA